MREDLINYLRIIVAISIITPLFFVLVAMDFGILYGSIITGIVYVMLSLISIPLYNYLEYGQFVFRL